MKNKTNGLKGEQHFYSTSELPPMKQTDLSDIMETQLPSMISDVMEKIKHGRQTTMGKDFEEYKNMSENERMTIVVVMFLKAMKKMDLKEFIGAWIHLCELTYGENTPTEIYRLITHLDEVR